MGEFFSKAVEWVQQHKALAIAISMGFLLLLYLWKSSRNAAQANAAAATQAVPGGPSDQILSQEIQAQAALQQERIVAQAQSLQYGYQAQVDLATIQAQEYASNAQNQAALTLGLAQAGDSTQSILQLLGAQPGVAPTTSVVGNTTTSTATSATLTGAAPTGGTGTNAHINPSPVLALARPSSPAETAARTYPYLVSPATYNVIPGGTQLVPTPAYAHCSPLDPGCVESNQDLNIQWETAVVHAQDANNQNQCEANQQISVSAGRSTNAAALAACGFSDPNVPPSVSPLVSQTNGVLSPTTTRTAGGPHFFLNAAGVDVVGVDGSVDAGGVLTSIHNASAGDRTAILASYGVQNTAAAQTAIGHMLGSNEPVTHTGVS